MRSGKAPSTFDLGDVLARSRRQLGNRLSGVTLSLPFLSFSVNPNNREQQIAHEIVTRLKDRRVLSAYECCDDCIDRALASLREIRQTLIDKQVELSEAQDGAALPYDRCDASRQLAVFHLHRIARTIRRCATASPILRF
jgi:hypothetical protein